MAEGWRMWAISLLTIMLLTLLSAAPIDITEDIKKEDVKDDNDAMHSHDENVTRGVKFFGHNQFEIGNINVPGSIVGDVVSIGHEVKIDVQGHTHDHHHHEDDTVIECKEGLREMFKSIDSNKDGLIDAMELLGVCHQNNIQITEPLAVRILTLPEKMVGFNIAKFCVLLKDCPSTNSEDSIYCLLQLFDKGVTNDEDKEDEEEEVNAEEDIADCVLEDNMDYAGNDIRGISSGYESKENCAKWCGETEGCKFWTFVKSSEGCWLKDKVVKAPNSCPGGASNCISGTKGCANMAKDRLQKGQVSDRLQKGQKLLGDQNEWLRAQNGEYDLVMQSDGNLVIYRNHNNVRTAAYSTHTSGAGSYLEFQQDGNLVIYKKDRTVAWATETRSLSADDTLVMQNDGNLVLYAADEVLWASDTVCEVKRELLTRDCFCIYKEEGELCQGGNMCTEDGCFPFFLFG